MIVAIHQPNYIPWLGYFYKMANCDIFVFLNDALHSKKYYTHRSRIKTKDGVRWLTVPLSAKEVKINELVICNDVKWQLKHWNIMETAYRKAPYWDEYSSYFKDIYDKKIIWSSLSELNYKIISIIRDLLGITTPTVESSELQIESKKGSERNLCICKQLGADIYLSGEGAKRYNDEEAFNREGINLAYTNYKYPLRFPVYHQLWGDFAPNLSIIDLLFNEGPNSLEILKSPGPPDF